MNRMEMEKFYEKEVWFIITENLRLLENEYENKKEEWKLKFIEEFQRVCVEIDRINMGTGKVPGYLIFHLLRTKIIDHLYDYSVQFYESNWYLREGTPVALYNVDFIYHFLEKSWKETLVASKKYIDLFTEADIQFIMLEEVDKFHAYVIKLLRYSILEAINTESYINIEKSNRFIIQTGEYFDICDYIYIEEKNKDFKKLKSWINKREDTDCYMFEDFKGIDLSHEIYSEINFSYADFRKSNLNGAQFISCNLVGTKFSEYNLQEASFKNCKYSNK